MRQQNTRMMVLFISILMLIQQLYNYEQYDEEDILKMLFNLKIIILL